MTMSIPETQKRSLMCFCNRRLPARLPSAATAEKHVAGAIRYRREVPKRDLPSSHMTTIYRQYVAGCRDPKVLLLLLLLLNWRKVAHESKAGTSCENDNKSNMSNTLALSKRDPEAYRYVPVSTRGLHSAFIERRSE